jgi:tetratricopeptide (TPR) repeat protein
MVWSNPKDPNAARHAQLIVAGMAALEASDLETAKSHFRAVLDQNIEHPDALFGMGLVARKMGQHRTGAELIRRAIKVSPNPAYWSNLGNVLLEMGEFEAGLTAQKEAFRLNPSHAGVVQNYANALNHLDRYYEAMPLFRKLARTFPDNLKNLVNYATVLTRIGEYAAANKVFRQAQAINQTDSTCNFHYAVNLMATGEWDLAWQLYDSRFHAPSYQASARTYTVTNELPEDMSGERLFLFSEQGIGDEIRFAGMVNEALDRGGQTTLECHKKLVPLYERSFPRARVVQARWEPAETGSESFDRYLPTGSLGKFFRTNADSFPRTTGYLKPDAERTAVMKAWLDRLGDGPKIGICWRSSMAGHLRSTAYARIDDLEPLFKISGVTLVNLQYDEAGEELERARTQFGATVHVCDGLDLFNDLDGAAALTSCLEFVVSANTSVACMAGALGVPGVEFRARPIPKSGTIEGQDPWFPSIRMIGKRPAEPWSGVFRAIVRDIETRLVSD